MLSRRPVMGLERFTNQKNVFIAFIVAFVLLISYLHYSTIPGIKDLHNIFAELYYLPLMIGALVFGMRGAVITFIVVSSLYIPHVVINWTNEYAFIANKLLHAVISGLFALLAGYFVDRQRKLREQAERDRYLAGLGQAAAAIVHDLKNPLISIMGFARRIRQGKGNVTAASETIMKSAEDMQLIVQDVLDFAKPQRMVYRETDAGEFIRTVCGDCGMKAAEKGVVVSGHIPDEPVSIFIDRSHMKRALINLIHNAIEASRKSDVVSVTANNDGEGLTIRITDHGPGMERETLENVFIPFYTKKSSGTGLGMAIAKKIIEGHQGEIRIESRPGTGTEVTVHIPCKRAADKKDVHA